MPGARRPGLVYVRRTKQYTEHMASDPRSTARIDATVYGLVQGVFFRYFTQLTAQRLGLAGTVTNQPEGTVRVVACGSREGLQALIVWLHHGPDLARVERVEIRWSDAPCEEDEFRILR